MREKMIWGRYIKTDSWIHRLDPRAKLTAMLLYLITVMLIHSYGVGMAVMLFAAVVMYTTNISLSLYLRAVRPLRFLILFILIFPIFFVHEETLWLNLGPISIYEEGVRVGVLAALRIILFISCSAIVTFTTTPAQLTQALEDVLLPLKWFGLSPQKMAFMVSVSLRFVPTLFEEADKILKSQASRGADLQELPWKAKAKVLISLLVPVTVSAIKRAGELIDSMQARGFQLGAPRIKYHVLDWKFSDSLFVISFAGVLVILLVVRLTTF